MTLPLFASHQVVRRPHLGRRRAPFSPLVLADRLIGLAQEADRAGLHDSAARLLGLVFAVLDDPSTQPKEA